MHPGQFRYRLSLEDINRGVGMLESVVSQRHVAGILHGSQSVISRICNCHLTHGDPTHTWRRMRQGYNSTSGPFFVDSVSTSMVSECYVLGTELGCAFLHKE